MKKLLLSAAILGILALAASAKSPAKDPVVMTIDNQDVKLSEFEYLYNKNSSQQITPITFDEYVDMFVNYKLKVADALNARLDTTAQFRNEFNKFRRDLAQPYLRDTIVEEQLIQEAYSHAGEEVFVSHIMLPAQDPRAMVKLDSIRNLIINGEITFEEAAINNSVDRGSSSKGGRMGWVTGMSQFPWAFEKAAFDTPVGEMSEVINSGVGYHIVRPEERRPAKGQVEVSHILLLTRDMDDNSKARQKAKIDSIYEVAKNGADFAELAKKFSQDPGSARKGGHLDWFGSGRMVPEFETVSFALADGEISEPFATSYGYHIVKKHGSRGVLPLETVRPTILKAMESDARGQQPIKANIEKMAKATGSSISSDYKPAVAEILAEAGDAIDPEMIDKLKAIDATAYVINGAPTTLSEVLAKSGLRAGVSPQVAKDNIDRAVTNAFDSAIIDLEIAQLEATEPAYANLVNEYRDGILLFDISNQRVWDKATKDAEGLKTYFEANKANYCNWTEPRFKSYVIFAPNDSTLAEVKAYVEQQYGGKTLAQIDQEAFTQDLKKKFGKNAKVERVIAAKGDNAITDYLAFGADKPATSSQNWKAYFAFASEMIDQPTEVSDVKGLVVTDYQTQLEKDWVKELHQKYPVKINKKELKKADK